MPRVSVNLDPYKEEILHLLSTQKSFSDILQYLQTQHELPVSDKTLRRRLKTWNVSVRTLTSNDSTLQGRISDLFFHGLNDNQILHALREEGFSIGPYALGRLRSEYGLKRRLRTQEERDQSQDLGLDVLTEELQKGVIEGYGRGLLHAHFQQLGVQISRDRLFAIYRSLVPDAIERRTRNMQRHRGEYIVPGPNFVWSVDGYLKLAGYGVEVYAAIDAYSRYIIWIYVGISARTAVSVLRQYLDTVSIIGQHPRFIRSDHGGETVLLASAHHQLQRTIEPDLQFRECYLYGTSTTNQRIESWWNQLTKGLLFRWRVCFFMAGHIFTNNN